MFKIPIITFSLSWKIPWKILSNSPQTWHSLKSRRGTWSAPKWISLEQSLHHGEHCQGSLMEFQCYGPSVAVRFRILLPSLHFFHTQCCLGSRLDHEAQHPGTSADIPQVWPATVPSIPCISRLTSSGHRRDPHSCTQSQSFHDEPDMHENLEVICFRQRKKEGEGANYRAKKCVLKGVTENYFSTSLHPHRIC